MEEEGTICGKESICNCVIVWIACLVGVIILYLCIIQLPDFIYVQDVYVPALDTTDTSTGNGTTPFDASIFVNLGYYATFPTLSKLNEESELAVFYGQGITPVAGYTVGAFSTGWHTTVYKMAAMEAPELPWEEAIRAVSAGLTVELELQLREVGDGCALVARVSVDTSGHMVPNGPVELY